MQTFNLFDPSVRADPFATYAQMRDAGVSMAEPGGFYVLSRHADVSAAFRDTASYSSAGFAAVLAPDWVGDNPVARSLLLMDPPKHTTHRGLISRAFVADVLAALERIIEARAIELLSDPRAIAGETFDAVDDLALPLSGTVAAEILGVDRELAPRFAHWTNTISRITPIEPPAEAVAEVKAAIAEQIHYFGDVIDDRLANPRAHDLPSALCHAQVEGQRLTRDELLSFMTLLVGAAFETTVHLLAKSMLLLAHEPGIHDAVRAQPELAANFVEEMLRFDGPTHMLMRLTTRELAVHDVSIPAHAPVGLMIGAANRDPAQFPDPDRFALDRKIQGALAFGHGPHVCVGAALARSEGRIFIRELTQRFARVEVDEGPRDWNYALHVRGLNHLPVRLRTPS